MTDMSTAEDLLEGEDMLNLEDLDEKEVLGDDDDEKISTIITKQEIDGDGDLYDAAIEPSGAINEKRESAEIQSSLPPNSVTQKSVKPEGGSIGGGQTGKRYCCYIGNMTWWTTDIEIEKAVNSFGIEDMIDIKFYENRNNGQSKGFALVVFSSEQSVKTLMEKLPNKKIHDQSLVVLPYTKQSMAKLEEATKRYDQKGPGGVTASSTVGKEEKVLNIGTIRIGANGAPVPQLMAPINLAQLARPVQPTQQPASLLSLNLAPPISRPPQVQSVGMSTSIAATPTVPPGTPSLLGTNVSAATAVAHQQQQQQQQIAALAAQQQAAAASALLLQQQQQAAVVAQRTAAPLNLAQPPPGTGVAIGVGGGHGQQQQQSALQQAMSRPPPSLHSLGGASQSLGMPGGLMHTAGHQLMQPHQQQYRSAQMAGTGLQQTMQAPTAFPPGAHINPQVYPGYAQSATGAYGGLPDNGALMSETEFQEIMNRNQTVSSSAIHRAVSDAAGGDYSSAIETLITAISLIRQSRVAHDDRCKLLVNTLQDTLNGIEAKSYSMSRKHRRERSRSPIRNSKRHRRSHSRSRSRDRGGYDYSPVRHSMSRRY